VRQSEVAAIRFAEEVDRLRAALRTQNNLPSMVRALQRELDRIAPATLAADDRGRYLAANACARALTGFTASELRALNVTDLTPAGYAADGEELWDDFVGEGEQRGEYELRRKDGTTVRVRYWAYANVAPGVHVSVLLPFSL
jgi:PAS domain S-box-containing protein